MNGTVEPPRTPAPGGRAADRRYPRPWTSGSRPSPARERSAACSGRLATSSCGAGYGHTLREIAQQPVTWIETAARMRELAPLDRGEPRRRRRDRAHGLGQLGLRRGVRGPVPAAPPGPSRVGGAGRSDPDAPGYLPARRPAPSSWCRSPAPATAPRAAPSWTGCCESRPQARHLFITCNRDGALATSYRDRPGVRTIVLDEKTDDRSLVMTSSFTNLVLAGRALGGEPERLRGARPRARERRRAPPARAGRRAGRGRAERLRLRRLPGQRLPPRLGPRGRAQDAGDERRRRLDAGRVLPRPAARADVRRSAPTRCSWRSSRPTRWCAPTSSTCCASSTARRSARAAWSSERGIPPEVGARPGVLPLDCGTALPVRGRGPDAARRRDRAAPRVLPLPGRRLPARLALGRTA